MVTIMLTRIAPLLLFVTYANAATDATEQTLLSERLVKWIVGEGGYFSAKQEIRFVSLEESRPRLGIFAVEEIEEGEVITVVPWDVILHDGVEEEEEENESNTGRIPCDMAKTLASELKLGNKSYYAPYVDHLLSQEKGRLPSSWSVEGKKLFMEVIGGKENPVLLDANSVELLDVDWYQICGGEKDDEVSATAALLAKQMTTDDEHMVPLADLYMHRGVPFQNVETELAEGLGYTVIAKKRIEVGEQIYDNIYDCFDCPEQDEFYGTPDMFRDHGFVESMPQQWSLKEKVWEFTVREGDQLLTFRNPSYDITFELRQEEDGLIVLEFIDIIDFESVEDHFLPWFREEVRRLNRMHDLEWKKTNPGVPRHEWESILAFHQAYLHALKVVLVFSEDDVPEEKFDEFEAGLEHHYNEFDRDEADRLGYNYQNCPSSEISDFRHYQPYEQKESYYQTMKWQHRPEDEDMCLHLDDMLQICSSYRPHYHEFFVHYPARYMESVKRVIFLGSGDAMLLHEILKYPDLELVVGLELDQAITRNSFKYFTTQPHYDDERVHWWYGDATKTLPLLPKEYWGSFDLALVDLSETVVSMSVTGQHDILEVISMLLKPEGVMLENELYLHKMDKHFDHTIQIFYGSPKVCTQVLTMSSNAVDFFRDKIYDHGIDSYLLKPIKEPHDRFKYIHDYIKSNAQSQGKCHASLGEGDAEETTVEYGRVAGILQIVEAENTSIPLDETIEGKIHSVLLEQGFTPISKLASNTGVQIAVVIMEEGYVIARMWPEHNYCGLDINLWGGFQKSGQLERALLGSLGSSSPSSYRVVVGGMHGSTTFEKDKEEIGVQISQKRNCKTQDLSQKARVDNETVMRVFAEVINLLESRELVVAVVCAGLENDCSIFNAVSEHSSVQRIVPIRACHGNGGIQDMHECENKILSEIEETVISKGLKLDVLLFDSKAPKSMYQLLNSIFTVERYRESWFQNRYVIAAPFLKDENLQQRFLEAYRKEEHHSTLFRADVTLKGRDQSFAGVSVILHGDDFALDQFYGMERSLQTMMDLSIEIESIIGGDLHPVADLEEETLSFGPDKYDASLARKQFAEQTPVGRQSVIQLELIDDEDDIEMPSFPELLGGLKATLEELNYTRSRVETFDGTDAATGVVGEGGVVIVVCSEGSVGLVWDGRHHVDINLFAYDEDELTANIFLNTFLRQTGDRLEPRLRDDQPRGFGRVVSFSKEIEEYEPPLAVVRTAV